MDVIERGKPVDARLWLADRLLRGVAGDAAAVGDLGRLDELEAVCDAWAAASVAEQAAAWYWVRPRGRRKLAVVALPGQRRLRLAWRGGAVTVTLLPDGD